MKVLITGITGNFGYAVYQQLKGRNGITILAGARNPERVNFFIEDRDIEVRRFDFMDPDTYEPVLDGIDTLVLVRPPSLSKVRRFVRPFIDACKKSGLRHILFLSIQGAERNRWVPHHKIEGYIRDSGIAFTFLRPSFFMENLLTTHREEIRDRSELIVPAGRGRTNFIAIDDIAAAAAQCVGDSDHFNKAYELTGQGAYTYHEVASVLSEELGRTVAYREPGVWDFFRYRKKRGDPFGFIFMMALIYRSVKKGKAAESSEELEKVFGITPRDLRRFVREKLDYLA